MPGRAHQGPLLLLISTYSHTNANRRVNLNSCTLRGLMHTAGTHAHCGVNLNSCTLRGHDARNHAHACCANPASMRTVENLHPQACTHACTPIRTAHPTAQFMHQLGTPQHSSCISWASHSTVHASAGHPTAHFMQHLWASAVQRNAASGVAPSDVPAWPSSACPQPGMACKPHLPCAQIGHRAQGTERCRVTAVLCGLCQGA